MKIKEQSHEKYHSGFKNKIRTIEGFIKPAFISQTLKHSIQDITSTWAKNIMNTLHNHYHDSLKHFTAQLINHTNLSQEDRKLAIEKATNWFTTQHKNIDPQLYQSFTSHINKHIQNMKSTQKCTVPFKDLAFIKLPTQKFNHITLNQDGHYILPGQRNNKSHINLQHHFFSENEADTIVTQLNSLPFKTLYQKIDKNC